jgi:replicative DNA helicase
VDEGLEELFTASILQPGLRWRMQCLNESLGSLRKGDFGFIFARPEVGKTTFLASEATHMLTQTDGNILWVNNEEQSNKVKMRYAQAYFGITRNEFLKNLNHYSERYEKEVASRLIIPRGSTKDYKVVEKLCVAYEPKLIIIDALDAMEGFKADREDLRLGAIFTWARELAKEYGPTIGVTWADGTAEGVKWLNMGHVVNAKTEKQKPADWILGIGKSNDNNLEYVRHLNISKNKLQGDEDSDPNMRHAKIDCIIDPDRARFKDI